MLIKTIDKWKIKPKKWGPFSLARQTIYKNFEEIYGINSNMIAKIFPIWENGGNTIYDYANSRKDYVAGSVSNNGTFYGDVTWDDNKIKIGSSQDVIITNFSNTYVAIGTLIFSFIPNWNYDDGVVHVFIDTYWGGNKRFLIFKESDNKTYFYTDSTLRGSFEYEWQAQKTYNCVILWNYNYFFINGILEFSGIVGGLGLGANSLYMGDSILSNPNQSWDSKLEYFIILNDWLTRTSTIKLINDRPYGFFGKEI